MEKDTHGLVLSVFGFLSRFFFLINETNMIYLLSAVYFDLVRTAMMLKAKL